MAQMLERVARALCEQDIRWKRRHDTGMNKLEAMIGRSVDANWRDYICQAETAFSAMKYEDGTDESALVAASIAHRLEPISLSEAWDDMIDSALKGGQ